MTTRPLASVDAVDAPRPDRVAARGLAETANGDAAEAAGDAAAAARARRTAGGAATAIAREAAVVVSGHGPGARAVAGTPANGTPGAEHGRPTTRVDDLDPDLAPGPGPGARGADRCENHARRPARAARRRRRARPLRRHPPPLPRRLQRLPRLQVPRPQDAPVRHRQRRPRLERHLKKAPFTTNVLQSDKTVLLNSSLK